MGLIGQRLTEWQTLFLLIFCGAASALRFSGKKILLITPHPRGAKHLFWIGRLSFAALTCRQWQTSEAQLSHRSRKGGVQSTRFLGGGAKHPFYWAAQFRCAHLPPVANKRSAVEPPIQKRRGSIADVVRIFARNALREWTNRSMTEKIRKQRSEIARETTRPQNRMAKKLIILFKNFLRKLSRTGWASPFCFSSNVSAYFRSRSFCSAVSFFGTSIRKRT